MKMCLHQWIKPKGPYVEVPGVGRCEECIPHEDNKKCVRYSPVCVKGIEVEEENVKPM